MIGLQMPTTPGSINPGVLLTRTCAGITICSRSKGTLTLRARSTRHHAVRRTIAIARNPHAHTANSIGTAHVNEGAFAVVDTPNVSALVNGSVTRAIVKVTGASN